jgi:hypothetical protein
VAGMSALYDVTREEREAIRRYVADWSKNSVLLPLRGKDGKLKYIDFSHMNAYDTVTRPIQTILNRVQAGEQDKDGMMDDFIMGMVESTKELGSPFISESIWTEALSDLFMRGGRTREGFKVWNPEDTVGSKMSKGVAHLIQSQAPLNWKQLQRIGLSMKPVDDIGRFDDRGREYELGNEVAGIIGARAIEIEPEKAIKYKVADYLRGARDSRSLFSTVVLRGGVVEPKDVVDAYINANRALFLNQKELYKDLEAAKILKGDESQIIPFVAGKIGKRNYGAIQSEQFVPYIPSRNVFIKAQQIAEELGVPNSLVESMGAIMQIRSELFNVGLEDEFPEIDNPLDVIVLPDLVGQVNTMIGNNPTNAALAAAPGATGFVGQGNINIDPVTRLTAAEEIYLDPTEKVYRKNQRTNTRLT